MTAIFDNAARQIAALDFSKDVEKVSQLSAERTKISEGIEKATARLGEIGFLINSRIPEQEAGKAVADAILEGEEAGEAARLHAINRDALAQERADLSAGLSELRRRETAIGRELQIVQDSARARLAAPLQSVIAEVMEEAKEAAAKIATAYATLQGLSIAARTGTAEAQEVGQAVARLRTLNLIAYQPRMEVPEGVAELLAPVEKIGEALPVHVPAWVSSPDDLQTMTLVAGLEARRAVG